MVGELDGEAVERTAVKAVDEALDDELRDERRERELVEQRGVEVTARVGVALDLSDDLRVAALHDLAMKAVRDAAGAGAQGGEEGGDGGGHARSGGEGI